MGFFDSIISGISDAGGWLSDNSDSIMKVAGAIASVIAVATNEEVKLDDSQNQLPHIHGGLAKNSTYLLKQMDIHLPVDTEDEFGGATTAWADLTGVWPDPSITPGTAGTGGYPRQDIVADIAKFMGVNGMPSIIQGSNGSQDLAQCLAAQIMENSNPDKAAPGSGKIVWTPLLYKDSNAGVSVKGMHGYYSIPLGMAGVKQAWHSCIRLRFTSTAAAKAAFEEREKLSALPRVANPPSAPYNTTTVNVTWNSGLGTKSIMDSAVQKISSDPMNWYVEGVVTDDSQSYVYTIYTQTNIAPGGVKQGVSDAINQSMPPPAKENSTTAAPSSLPTVQVSNSGTVVS
ncbi:Nn.00g105330.m01.CDS01 [Neocucurbitaria sp. VM-36]